MKIHIYKLMLFVSIIGIVTSCNVEEFSDLNNPEVDAFESNLTRGDLQDLIGGILYSSRERLGTYFDDCGVIGREYWRFSSSDPRFTSDLLGGSNAVLDNNTFYITGPWASRYRTVKNANLILGFLDSQDLSAQFTDAEIRATRGFLNTFIAYELLLNLNLTDENGIRIDVVDPSNLGPFVSKNEALTAIQTLLADAKNDLTNGGDAFPFPLPSGMFSNPNEFGEATSALAARVAAYRGDANAILTNLNASFFNLDGGDLNTGIYYNFSADQTDLLNPMFFPVEATTAGARIAHPSFIVDAEANDLRLNKVQQRSEPLTLDNLTGDYAVFRYATNTDAIPIIRNEELILLYAEANITINPAEAVNALNIIRASASLPPYTGDPTSTEELTLELLNQRRYSLYAEGHRWIDIRRFGLLSTLPIDRIDIEGNPDDVWENFPIPLTENQ